MIAIPPRARALSRLRARAQSGIVLLEALLAIVMLAIGLLGTIGLQARAYSALSDAGMRAEATIAADKLLGVMGNDQLNLAQYALADNATPGTRLQAWYAETRTFIPGARVVVGVTPSADLTRTEVVITIRWTRKDGGPENTHAVTAYLARS